MSNSDTTYSGKKAAGIVGITYRQLDYWARTELVSPSIKAAGSGSRRQYSYEDLLRLKVVKELLDAGIKLEKIRDVFRNITGFGSDVKDANLIIEGEEVFVYDREQLVSAVDAGQLGMFTVMTVKNVHDKVEAKILELADPVEQDLKANPAPQTLRQQTL